MSSPLQAAGAVSFSLCPFLLPLIEESDMRTLIASVTLALLSTLSILNISYLFLNRNIYLCHNLPYISHKFVTIYT